MIDKAQIEKIQALIQSAYDGRFPVIEEILNKIGYQKPPYLVTTVEMADILGVAQNSIRTWTANENLPLAKKKSRASGGKITSNMYDPIAVLHWFYKRQIAQITKDNEEDILSKEYWDVRLKQEKYQEVKIKNEERARRLLNAAELTGYLTNIGRVFRGHAETIERKFGSEVGDAIRLMIDNAVAGFERACEKEEAEGDGA